MLPVAPVTTNTDSVFQVGLSALARVRSAARPGYAGAPMEREQIEPGGARAAGADRAPRPRRHARRATTPAGRRSSARPRRSSGAPTTCTSSATRSSTWRCSGSPPASRGEMRQALPGDLPDAEEERAKSKPDLEALSVLPPFEGAPFGGLLGLGSGSGPGRDRGFYWELDAAGALAGEPSVIDLQPALRPPPRASSATSTSRAPRCAATASSSFIAATPTAATTRSPSSTSRGSSSR